MDIEFDAKRIIEIFEDSDGVDTEAIVPCTINGRTGEIFIFGDGSGYYFRFFTEDPTDDYEKIMDKIDQIVEQERKNNTT